MIEKNSIGKNFIASVSEESFSGKDDRDIELFQAEQKRLKNNREDKLVDFVCDSLKSE